MRVCHLKTETVHSLHPHFDCVLKGISFWNQVTLRKRNVTRVKGCGQGIDPTLWLYNTLCRQDRGSSDMAGRQERRVANAGLPEHWRDVREWSIEKRQSHRVRLSLVSEPVLSVGFSLSFSHTSPFCFLGTGFLISYTL